MIMTTRQRPILISGLFAIALALLWVPYTATLNLDKFSISASAGYETIFNRPSNTMCAQSIINQTHAFDFHAIQPRCQVGIDTARLVLTIGAILAATLSLFLMAGESQPSKTAP